MCNNLQNPLWGSSNTMFGRLLPGIPKLYKVTTFDNSGIPVPQIRNPANPPLTNLNEVDRFGVNRTVCSTDCGKGQGNDCVDRVRVELPSARYVSSRFFEDNPSLLDSRHTELFVLFAQFVDHGLTMSPEEPEANCCDPTQQRNRASCMPIYIPSNDPFYQSTALKMRGVNQSCLDHSRSTGFCDDGPEPTEQFNALTHFVDGSQVYGSMDADALLLRANDGTGKLRVDPNSLLPTVNGSRIAGDQRRDEMPALAMMHTVFLREHNRICDALLRYHPGVAGFSDEDFYQNARRIVLAQWQKIVYGDFLLLLLGSDAINKYNLQLVENSVYTATTDPTQPNSFGTAAFRWGHTMVRNIVQLFRDIRAPQSVSEYNIGENYFNLTFYESNNGQGLEQILLGLIRQNAAQYDRHVAVGLSNQLNANANPIVTGGPIPGVGGDLISRNIQRGRDHGLPSYVAFYRYVLLMAGENPNDVMDCWSKRPPTISQENWNLLKSLYLHPYHIDLFVGGIAEEPYQGAIFGRTFRAIIAQTFKNLKDGDRFFFTHRGNMNSAEYNQIMGRKLYNIICETSSTIEAVKENVFLVNSRRINCHPTKVNPKKTTLDIKAFALFKASTSTSTGIEGNIYSGLENTS